MILLFRKKILQSMYLQAVPDREQNPLSMELPHSEWWQEV